MNLLAYAHSLIEKGQITQFFALMHLNLGTNALLTSLENTFIAGKASAEFSEQLKTFALQHTKPLQMR